MIKMNTILKANQEILPRLVEAYSNWIKITSYYNSIYFKAIQLAAKEEGTQQKNFYEKWLQITDAELETGLRSEVFTSVLSEFVNAHIELRRVMREAGYPVLYFGWLFDSYVRSFMIFASLPKDYDFASFDVVYSKGRTRLLHYHSLDSSKESNKPLLLIYAPINKFHIMDISKDRSVVRNLLSKGLDVYLLDWGFPDWNDSGLSLEDYVSYVQDAVQVIKNKSNLDKISILGYCWGGIISLCYAALHDDSIQSLSIMATPVDFSKDTTILANWSRALDTDKLIDEFGHLDGVVLDLGFLLRNPPRYTFDKYINLLKNMNNAKFVDNFISVEKWLHDTPMIPGRLYRDILHGCYKDNLLVSHKLKLGEKQIDLRKITAPLLTIIAEKDDLVSPESTLALNDLVSSKEKETFVLPTGHVGLCISTTAHQRLWPKVAAWILSN